VASSSRILTIASVLKRSSIFAGLTYKKEPAIHSGALFILKERKKERKRNKADFVVMFCFTVSLPSPKCQKKNFGT
jgi:hypothetical protein